MLFKRKRSISEHCSSSISSSVSSATSLTTMDSLFDVPAHLHSRTFKRHRDSRPSDQEVHQRTLGLLYSAQQRHQQQQEQQQQHVLQPPPPPPPPQQEPAPSNNSQQQQQSLHRFWNINSTPSSTASGFASGLEHPPLAPSSCDDCGAGLAGGGGGGSGADDMDVDGSGLEDTACGACGKHVCFSCSVSNLGEQKRCLKCAGRKVWIGGIGWTNASVSVC